MLAEQPDLKVVAAVDRPPAALEKARAVKPNVGASSTLPWEITIVTASSRRSSTRRPRCG